MTISSYQVDSVLKAYNKQSRVKTKAQAPPEQQPKAGGGVDTVTLSREKDKPEVFDKISYSLRYTILKDSKPK